jgi:hypothetical protein
MRCSVADFGIGLPVARLSTAANRNDGDPQRGGEEKNPNGDFEGLLHFGRYSLREFDRR